MKFLLPALAIILFSCTKTDTGTSGGGSGSGGSGSGGSGGTGGTTSTLGIQKVIVGSFHLTWAWRLECNANRLLLVATENNSGTSHDVVFAGDDKDSVYKIKDYQNNQYFFDIYTQNLCIKPNGDIVFIKRQSYFGSPDSVLVLINKKGTDYWQLKSKVVYSSFWDGYFFSTYQADPFATSTGRLVLTGWTSVAVSDDDGVTWRKTFNFPAGWGSTTREYMHFSTIGSRQFISSFDDLLYSDNDIETGAVSHLPNFSNTMNSSIAKFDDGRLAVVTGSGAGQGSFFQSFNNGITWSAIPKYDPADTLSEYSPNYFGYIGGTTYKGWVKYKPCGAYYSLNLDPTKKFAFYPAPISGCPSYLWADDVVASCQRPDKRIYYAREYYDGGGHTWLYVLRDY